MGRWHVEAHGTDLVMARDTNIRDYEDEGFAAVCNAPS